MPDPCSTAYTAPCPASGTPTASSPLPQRRRSGLVSLRLCNTGRLRNRLRVSLGHLGTTLSPTCHSSCITTQIPARALRKMMSRTPRRPLPSSAHPPRHAPRHHSADARANAHGESASAYSHAALTRLCACTPSKSARCGTIFAVRVGLRRRVVARQHVNDGMRHRRASAVPCSGRVEAAKWGETACGAAAARVQHR